MRRQVRTSLTKKSAADHFFDFALAVIRRPGQVILAAMDEDLDPAAVFASALSLYEACLAAEKDDPKLSLSKEFHGFDEFMRQVMRVSETFERWACQHVVFEETQEVWPYQMTNCFGDVCLRVMNPKRLAQFCESDCTRIAVKLRLPLRLSDGLCLPIDVRVPTRLPKPGFVELRIQAVVEDDETGDVSVFTAENVLEESACGPVYFALYGVGDDGLSEHIADRTSYPACRELAQRLVPGLEFPEEVIWNLP